MSNHLYRVIITIILCILVAAVSWVAASRFTMATLKVWAEPRNHIAVMDYFGNIDHHWWVEQ